MRSRRAWFLVGVALVVLGLAAGLSSSDGIRRRSRSLTSRIRERRPNLFAQPPVSVPDSASAERLDVEPDITLSAEESFGV